MAARVAPPPPQQQNDWVCVDIDEPVSDGQNCWLAFTVQQPGPQNAPINSDPIEVF